MDFEAEMKKLADIAAKMEAGDLPLEESMKLYTEAVELTKKLKDYIEQAKQKVETLEGN
ncbi:MAG: exodeoxyribonuclease VII small subunit [Oscillospiraceae bacterium]|nr:exodeoxyribonuclease VII small subunit [Oscillospiraceae bacterium]